MTHSVLPALTIRSATLDDAPELARLFTTLGHPTTAVGIVTLWPEWAAAGNVALVAAGPDGTLAGVATVHRMIVLQRSRPVGRITALVVDNHLRGRGVGRALVGAAEEMLTRTGCGLIEVTSNMRRVDAHAFYERLGYERTSFRFAKVVAPRAV